ncbi:Uncharacterised protein [uncultured archaeon]|nr:Uncharacterised protein [uncultured archaeon]
MVNKYILAILLTSILVLMGLALMIYTGDAGIKRISDAVEASSLEAESTQQLLQYGSLYGDVNGFCPVLMNRADFQSGKVVDVLAELQKASPGGSGGDLVLERESPGNINPEFMLLKRSYLNQSIGLYLLMEQARLQCAGSGASGVKPLVFFYLDKQYCPDCVAQGKILSSVRDKCGNVRVFALPYDLGIPVAEAIASRYSVGTAPAIIYSGKKLEGLAAEESVEQLISCT